MPVKKEQQSVQCQMGQFFHSLDWTATRIQTQMGTRRGSQLKLTLNLLRTENGGKQQIEFISNICRVIEGPHLWRNTNDTASKLLICKTINVGILTK